MEDVYLSKKKVKSFGEMDGISEEEFDRWLYEK